MGIIDIVFLAVLAIGFISGLQKGLITSALSLVAILGASIIAGSLENMLASRLVNADLYIDWVNTSLKPETMNPEQWQAVWNNICHVISFTIVFLIAWAALQLLVNLLNNVFRMPKLRALDGVIGGVIGVVGAYMIICFTVAVIRVVFQPLQGDLAGTLLSEGSLGGFFGGDKKLADLFNIGNMISKLK